MPPTHITVTAPEGRLVPIHPSDGTDPSGMLLHVEAGTVCRVRYSQSTRRAINRGDLIPCSLEGRPVDVDAADCPKALDELEPTAVGSKLRLSSLAAKAAPVTKRNPKTFDTSEQE